MVGSMVAGDPGRARAALPNTGWVVRFERGAAGPGAAVVSGPRGRLALLTTGSPGPLVATSGGRGLVLWGDLDNLAELRARYGLDERQHEAEVALAAFARLGRQLPTALKGRHVVIAYDAANDLLLAARDRVGLVPLFRRRAAGALEFSVAIDAFDELTGSRATMDRERAAAYLSNVTLDLRETFLEGVERVPPGHVLLVAGGEAEESRHWLPPPAGAGADWVTEDELPRFGELLDAAVARPLRKGRGGIFMSGGLDSVSVAAAAIDFSRREGRDLPIGLSLLFPQQVSEEPIQRGVAQALGIELVALDFDRALGERGLLRRGLDLSPQLGAPLQNVWTPAYDILTAAGRELGVEQVLTGGGGDEWLTVTPLIAADYLARGDLLALFEYARALGRSLDIPLHLLWRNILWTNGARPLLHGLVSRARSRYLPAQAVRRGERALAQRLEALPTWVAPDLELRRRLVERVSARYRPGSSTAPLGPGGRYFNEMKVSLNHPLFALDVEEIFEDGRRNHAPHWDIYWDADLIEFLYRVPPRLLNSGGRSKGLVRAEVARRFPEFGFATQKKLVSRDFFVERFFAEVGPAFAELGGFTTLAEVGLVDPVAAQAVIDEAAAVTEATRVDRIWRLLSLEAWARSRV